MMEKLVYELNDNIKEFLNHFWPGPLTVVMKKKDIIPDAVSCGLDTVAIRMPNNENIEVKSSEFNLEDIAEDEIVAYVDGSYKKDTLEYGYGVVLILKDEVIELFGKGENPEVAKSRNVTGELFGSIRAISEAIKLKKKKITVFYDYQGILSWANGEWKCNLPLTIGYRDKIKDFRKEIEILFVKVKAHSNDKYNDLADHLAKKSLGIEK